MRAGLRQAQNKGLEFWQTINNTIILYDPMPADRLVQVAKRNLDDAEAEILNDKEQPEQREAPRVVMQDNPGVKARARSCTQPENLNEVEAIF